jgi:uncharacterized membrane protein HdeD (DUF308 family)
LFKSFKSSATSLIWQGVLAIVVGIISLSWPRVTVFALVILFAVYAFMASGLEAMQAFSSRKAGPVFGHLLLGLIALVAGVAALVWPAPTALVLVLVIGTWAALAGLVMIVAAFQKGEPAGIRALFILSGLALVAFGVVLFTHPGIGAVTIALLFGLFNLVLGISQIVAGAELRRTGKTLDSVIRPPDGVLKIMQPSDETRKPDGTSKHPVTN